MVYKLSPVKNTSLTSIPFCHSKQTPTKNQPKNTPHSSPNPVLEICGLIFACEWALRSKINSLKVKQHTTNFFLIKFYFLSLTKTSTWKKTKVPPNFLLGIFFLPMFVNFFMSFFYLCCILVPQIFGDFVLLK